MSDTTNEATKIIKPQDEVSPKFIQEYVVLIDAIDAIDAINRQFFCEQKIINLQTNISMPFNVLILYYTCENMKKADICTHHSTTNYIQLHSTTFNYIIQLGQTKLFQFMRYLPNIQFLTNYTVSAYLM